MKTMHFTNAWHASSGGIATFYRALLEASEASGRLMRLVVPSDENRTEDRGRYTRVYHVRAPRAPLDPSYRLLAPHRYLWPGGALNRILREERPDLIEVADKYTLNYLAGFARRGWIAGLAHRPAVVGLSCERMDDNLAAYLRLGAAGRTFGRWYMKWLYFPMFDHHITVSAHTAGELREASRGHKVKRGVWVRPMGVDVDLFRPGRRNELVRDMLRRRAGGGAGTVLLLYAGRLAAEKNLGLLAEMLERLAGDPARDYRLLIAGDGALRGELQRRCEERAPGAATFLGHFADRQRLAELYANCDVFVHPNPREPFGIAPLEAMASGLALVAPDRGGVTEYANSGNAWLARPRVEEFAEAVRAAAAGGEEGARKRRVARLTAEEHSWPRVCEGFLALYEELHRLASGQRGPAGIEPAFVSTDGNWLGMEA